MMCQFCAIRHAAASKTICTYCSLSYPQEVKEALYALTIHQVTGTAQENKVNG